MVTGKALVGPGKWRVSKCWWRKAKLLRELAQCRAHSRFVIHSWENTEMERVEETEEGVSKMWSTEEGHS